METVGEFLASKGSAVFSVRPEATVYEALEVMADKNIGAVIVTDGPHCDIAYVVSIKVAD